jgi:hypothetical protein
MLGSTKGHIDTVNGAATIKHFFRDRATHGSG